MKTESLFLKYFKFVFVICLAAVVVMLSTGHRAWVGPALIVMFASLALYFMSHRVLKSFAFTAWVFAFVAVSMVYPVAFGSWFGFDLKILIVPLIQIIMFGMGTTLSVADFGRVFKMPWPVFVGFVLQFSVMPLTGLALAKIFGFEPEIAAGVVLIGSCPGGVASNLMTYLARGNVALSVTMTSCSTLVSPIVTPFLMYKLAGQFIEINFLNMMLGIINMIIVPIVAGLIANRILYSRHKAFHSNRTLTGIAAAGILLATGIGFLAPRDILIFPTPRFSPGDIDLKLFANRFKQNPDDVSEYLLERFSPGTRQLLFSFSDANARELNSILLEELNNITQGTCIYDPKRFTQVTLSERTNRLLEKDTNGAPSGRINRLLLQDAYASELAKEPSLEKDGLVVGLFLLGFVTMAKLVINVWFKKTENWMDKALPLVSMVGICFIIAIITARSAEKLMTIGIFLIGVAIIHNFVGYILGYWFARAARLDESSCRTVAFEVGMQNGGMASGLAMNVLKSAPAALAPAIFGPWMNVSGSVLATWWHRKPARPQPDAAVKRKKQ